MWINWYWCKLIIIVTKFNDISSITGRREKEKIRRITFSFIIKIKVD